MTCIVGLVEDGCVYLAGDSAGVSGSQLTIRRDAKVFTAPGESDQMHCVVSYDATLALCLCAPGVPTWQ